MEQTGFFFCGNEDVNSYNLYFGWYLGELEQNDEFFDAFHAKYPDKPIGLSEYGADANPAFQSSKPEKGDYNETYQCVYHEHMLKMISARPWLWATHVWNMFDFAADGRDEGGKHGENQKGLVTFDRQEVNNWFDGELDENFWSVKDNMAMAMADKNAGPILKGIMDKAAAARGDVATATKDNPALKAMMARAMQRMTIEGLLKQAGTDPEQMKQLNRLLQTIPKNS